MAKQLEQQFARWAQKGYAPEALPTLYAERVTVKEYGADWKTVKLWEDPEKTVYLGSYDVLSKHIPDRRNKYTMHNGFRYRLTFLN